PANCLLTTYRSVGFVAVRIFGQAFRQVFGQHLVCSRRPILPALVVADHPPRKLKLRSISLRRMPWLTTL
uniref:hypothetical protein n=1 Tax=Collinsella aerofaciens TaxID=74426 RepID=UPI0022E33AB5